LLKDGYEMSGDGPSEELQEVEEELVNKKGEGGEADDELDLEADQRKKKTASSALFASCGLDSFKVFNQVC
jgi:hypothetical protein